jgi:hypothetical protein
MDNRIPPSLSAALIGSAGTASGVGPSESISPLKTGRKYSLTPIKNRSLDKDGDELERTASAKLSIFFPEYEALWKTLIWDVTDRDFLPLQGQPRADCPEGLREFAEAHYTFFRSLMMAKALFQTRDLDAGSPLEPYYSNERFVLFYSQLGRIRDMVFLMLERMGQESGKLAAGKSLRRQSLDFDAGEVKEFIRGQISEKCSNAFDNWRSEVTRYRNLLHQVANALKFVEGKWLILKPSLVKGREGGWVGVLNRPNSDFIEIEGVMKKHFDSISEWGKEIWRFFMATVESWRLDKSFQRRLGLPSI